MPITHRGRDEVRRMRDRLTSIFTQIDGAGLPSELISHYSRYLAVLVSGYAEQSVKELVRQYVRTHADHRSQRYVGHQLKRIRNIDDDRLREILQSLDTTWWDDLQAEYANELEAFKSVAVVRNNVSHGGDSGITISTVRQYFDQISTVLSFLADRLDSRK
ncbi:HEPN domain-containing protein [Mycobacteroides abscessus]|uniref:HEPN domain-containing protein n=1 Tax=Mycobacteroides abscessus TaxID=36809 RepID=UPI0005E176CA|nr:Uncharacterised protein [Mycobacteroides abscessus]CPS30155.1 Uncharacterised protein [Mycobacteroides abscessus]CPS32110.1 Uncharacterised protein [Mycobacteroides abscessus]CPT14697.1 Uncharacterised protein [Mycobacteroides abscessus]CPT34268.1 Uncharacterised protein [Mycobacteroides abscessus]